MAGDQVITNPIGAFRFQDTSDWRLGKSDRGERLLHSEKRTFLAKGTIPPGSVVCFIASSSATDVPGVVVKATARFYSSIVGISDNNASVAAGATVEVVIQGLAFVDIGGGTSAANNTAVAQANSNQAAVANAELDATTIVGTQLGVFQGVKDANNRAPVFVNIR